MIVLNRTRSSYEEFETKIERREEERFGSVLLLLYYSLNQRTDD
jgi:hypothetical protein